jgi:hypothetical protein
MSVAKAGLNSGPDIYPDMPQQSPSSARLAALFLGGSLT